MVNYDGFTLINLSKKRLDAINIQSQEEFMSDLISKTFGHNTTDVSRPNIMWYNPIDGRFEVRFSKSTLN